MELDEMLNQGNRTHLEYLRTLPTGYLLDLLADDESIHTDSIRRILIDRGDTPDEIDRRVRRRHSSYWPSRRTLWRGARWASLGNSLLIFLFNSQVLYRLSQSDNPFKVLLFGLTLAATLFGFFLGYKLSTHLYQGGAHRLDCGFPLPVGHIDLESGQEKTPENLPLSLRIAVNALVGVNFTLFPLVLIIHLGS